MDLNFNNKLDEYYQKFVELQEKLKTSEEQRFMLEMKFNDMVHVAKEEEQAHYRKLRAQYKKFLEEDQKRQERNERIIRNLERVEAKISILSAKTERISMFRRQYHKYLKRIANSIPVEKISDSKISRERSFVKKEPLNELQKTLFRDDYSLPDRPKELHDKDTLIYRHPAVKKSLEKDRSNEEKIEFLDKYLQSSQKCRDVLNQERQAREKLTLDMPLDKIFHDECTSHSTNHATAVADDIMNSIYSRYYTKTDVTPKGNKVDLPKDMQNGNIDKSDYIKKNCKLDNKVYLDSAFTEKPLNDMIEKGKLTVTFNKEENVPQLKDKSKLIKDRTVLQQTTTYDFPKSGESYLQNQNKYDNYLSTANEGMQDNFKMSPAYVSNENNYYKNINNDEYRMTNDLYTDPQHSTIPSEAIKDTKNINKHKNVINGVLQNDNTLPSKIGLKNIGLVNDNPSISKHFEKTKPEVPYDSSVTIKNYIPQIASNQKQNQPNMLKDYQLRKNEGQSYDQIFKYEPNNPVEENNRKHQSREQPQEYNSIDQINTSEVTYYAEEPYQQSTRQLNAIVNEHDNQYNNEDNRYQEIDPSTQSDQLMYNNQDQFSIQYNENDESSGQPIQYNPNNQPPLCDQDEIAQSDQYNRTDPSVLQYNENSPYELAQFNKPGQHADYSENDPSNQQIQYNENPPHELAQFNEPRQQAEYSENDPSNQQIQYNENPLHELAQFNEPGQQAEYSEHDPSNQQIQYNENPLHELAQFNEPGQQAEYSENDPSNQQIQYNENPPHEPAQFNEPEKQAEYSENDPSNQQIQYNENSPHELAQFNKPGQQAEYSANDPSNQQIQYNENPLHELAQFNEPGQQAEYSENDPSNQQIQYNENSPHELAQFSEPEKQAEYSANDPSNQQIQYNENPTHELAQFNEPGQQEGYSANDPSNQQIQYNENGQPIQYDESGQPIGFDQYGQPIMYDQNGQIVQPQYDENGQFMPQYDENGQLIVLYDHNGQQLFDNQYKDNSQYDVNAQPMMQYDETGQPIYDQNQQQYYDYPDQYEGGDQGHYIETQGELKNQNEDGNQHQMEEQNYYRVDDQGHHPVTGEIKIPEEGRKTNAEYNQGQDNNIEAKHDIIEGNKEVVEINDDAAKPTNVMDILDTDTESVQQNTSKISNGSDFDFS